MQTFYIRVLSPHQQMYYQNEQAIYHGTLEEKWQYSNICQLLIYYIKMYFYNTTLYFSNLLMLNEKQ